MDRLSFKLAAVLGLQLVLAVVLWSMGPDYSAFKAKEPLLAFEPAKVDRIEIAESSANTVELVKENGKWTIPSMAGFPADGAKVNGLLTKLAALKKGWPVATSADAAKRFKVTADSYERRIVLKSGGKPIGEILLGTSPAFKQVDVRAGGDSNVYNVAFAAYEAGARGEEWMDRSLLNIPEDKIASIAIGDITLERKDGKFVLKGLAGGQKQDETATYRLAGALSFPAFEAVVGKGREALAKVNDPTIEVTVKRKAGDPIVLKYKKEAAGGAYLFSSSANDFLFRASEAAIEPIVKAKREALIEAPKKAAGEDSQAVKAGEPKKEGAQAASKPATQPKSETEPAKSAEPSKAQDENAKATSQAQKAGEPIKAEEGAKAATQPAAKAEEPARPAEQGAQSATQQEKPGEPQAPNGG